MVFAELQSKTRKQLLDLSRSMGIRVSSGARKDRLIRAILEANSAAPIEPERQSLPVGLAESKGGQANNLPKPQAEAPPPPQPGGPMQHPHPSAEAGSHLHEMRDLGELPISYGKTQLVLMEVEPRMVHAYWEVTPEDRRSSTAEHGSGAAPAMWVLRFYDVSDRASGRSEITNFFDIDIDLLPGSWHINLWEGGRSYFAEIGARAPDGGMAPVCRSNIVQLPHAGISPYYDPRWLRRDPESGRTEHMEAPANLPERSEGSLIESSSLQEGVAEESETLASQVAPSGVEIESIAEERRPEQVEQSGQSIGEPEVVLNAEKLWDEDIAAMMSGSIESELRRRYSELTSLKPRRIGTLRAEGETSRARGELVRSSTPGNAAINGPQSVIVVGNAIHMGLGSGGCIFPSEIFSSVCDGLQDQTLVSLGGEVVPFTK